MIIGIAHKWLGTPVMGGVSRVYRELCRELSASHRVITFSCYRCEWSPEHVRLRPSRNLDQYNRELSRAIQRYPIDVVECSSWEYELLTYSAIAKEHRAKVVVRTEFAAEEIGAYDLSVGEAALLGNADLIIAVSRYAQCSVRRRYSGIRVDEVICNGVSRFPLAYMDTCHSVRALAKSAISVGNLRFREPQEEAMSKMTEWFTSNRFVFLWVGKMTYMKGYDILCEIAGDPLLTCNYIVLLGHGRKQYEMVGRDNMVYLQDLPEELMGDLYKLSSAVLSTSRQEGFGLAVAEGILNGKQAFVPSGLQACREYMKDGRDGFFYESASHLARIVQRKVSLVTEAKGLRSWSECANNTVSAYQRACSE